MAGKGHKTGTKLPRRGTDGVKGDGSAFEVEIRAILAARPGLTDAQRSAIERRYVTLGIFVDRVRQLEAKSLASAADLREQRRSEDRMAKIRLELGAGPASKPPAPTGALDVHDREAFCSKHLTVADGSPFSLVGREWQRDKFWAPLDGYRLWAADAEKLCSGCRDRASDIVASVYVADETRTEEHAATGCAGLDVHMVWLVCEQLLRQQGKTTGVAGYSTSSLFKFARESIAYVAGSETQSEGIFRVNFGNPITNSPELKARAKVMRTRLIVPETESEFELFPTSLAGATGGSRTLVIVDEARDVPSHVFGAFVPQVYARNGWRCPSGKVGHAWSAGDLRLLEDRAGAAVDPAQESYGKKCGVCGQRLEPWIGRVAVMSSAQELDGSDADWFNSLCDQLEKDPEPDAYLYRSAQIVNPKVQRQIVSRTQSVLGRVPGLSETMSIEAGGVSKRKGEPFLSFNDIAACCDAKLVNRESGRRPGVAYLDLSDVSDPSSLVVLEDDSLLGVGEQPGEKAWTRVVTTRIEIFDPKTKNHPIVARGFVDDLELEAHLDAVVPLFKLLRLRIDDRHAAWARKLVARLQAKPWGRIVLGSTTWTHDDRRFAYNEMERRYLGRLIRTQDLPVLRQELVGARKFKDIENRIDVREAGSRNKKGVRHLDVAESLAACCYDAHEVASENPGVSMAARAQGAPVVRRVGPPTSRIFGKLGDNAW